MDKVGDTDMKVARSRGAIVPKDFAAAVKDIKLAILQSRARAAHASNVEALKLYFYVGGYVSKKTRTAKWGSGAIDALSNRLQVELPGLRGFSAASIKYMRLFFDEWMKWFEIRHLASDETSLVPIRHLASDEISQDDVAMFLSVGFTHHREILNKCNGFDERWYYIRSCAQGHWTVTDLLAHLKAQDYKHIGALPNNFAKTISPMVEATRAVRSFRDEYLLELVNLDNVDAIHDQDVDERVLSKSLVSNIEKTMQALGGDDFCAARHRHLQDAQVHSQTLSLPRPGHRRRPPRTCQRSQGAHQEERSFMKKIGNTQSGTLLVEMTDVEYEKLTAGAAVPVDAFMTMRMTVKDCVDYCAGKFAKIHPNKKSGIISTIKAAFNFKADITDAQAEQIYKGLLNKKLFKESEGRIEW